MTDEDKQLAERALLIARLFRDAADAIIGGHSDVPLNTRTGGQPIGSAREILKRVIDAIEAETSDIKTIVRDEATACLRPALQDLFAKARKLNGRVSQDEIVKAFRTDLIEEVNDLRIFGRYEYVAVAAHMGVRLTKQAEEDVCLRLVKFLELTEFTEMPTEPAIDATQIILRAFNVPPHVARQEAIRNIRKRTSDPARFRPTKPVPGKIIYIGTARPSPPSALDAILIQLGLKNPEDDQ